MAPVTGKSAKAPAERAASAADDATKGSAIKLAAEVTSRLLGLATTFLLLRGLGAGTFGVFGQLSVYALLLAELGELGIQSLASRALVAHTLSLGSLVRARLVAAGLAAAVALVSVPAAPALAALATRVARALGSEQRYALDGPALGLSSLVRPVRVGGVPGSGASLPAGAPARGRAAARTAGERARLRGRGAARRGRSAGGWPCVGPLAAAGTRARCGAAAPPPVVAAPSSPPPSPCCTNPRRSRSTADFSC